MSFNAVDIEAFALDCIDWPLSLVAPAYPIPALMLPANWSILLSESSYAIASAYCPPPLPNPLEGSDSSLNLIFPVLSVSALTSPLPPTRSLRIFFWFVTIASSEKKFLAAPLLNVPAVDSRISPVAESSITLPALDIVTSVFISL